MKLKNKIKKKGFLFLIFAFFFGKISFLSPGSINLEQANKLENGSKEIEKTLVFAVSPNPLLLKALGSNVLVKKNIPEVISQSSQFKCSWASFTSTNNKTIDFCTHPFKDIVSGHIRRKHRWPDCDILPQIWNNEKKNETSIYIEIGANIGSCVMEMLLSTDANIIAFEPHPMNQFNLLSTVAKLPKEYKSRFLLYPIGLGNVKMNTTIYSAQNNMGNSNLGKFIEDYGSQTSKKELQFQVHVDLIKNVLRLDEINVPLMKMDAQGFECRILEGMGSPQAKKIKNIKFEYAKKWLDNQNCEDFLPRLRNFDFKVTLQNGKEVLTDNPNFKLKEMIAKKQK
ncbi:hypothetical protein CTEN210_07070 [Chaetoceros tenuissimus]|jgi:FkbM family methyltransferase|uniref:Methyltransferase FkbM domain-containing protein n=1 Tax=Chaetoceros tenuissimus TaxID=426638 RepID=A0AAD3CU05_9STRA|nr:hypothetical protein CTEN210_07070 [Chaetoceros tenuissimus]